jgi:hypothetical protein
MVPLVTPETITNGVADPLTDKICRESGICNVKTQLLSKFFRRQLASFGRRCRHPFGQASLMPSSAPTTTGVVVFVLFRSAAYRRRRQSLYAQQRKLDSANDKSVSVVP